jgi:predicted transcriptional regulator
MSKQGENTDSRTLELFIEAVRETGGLRRLVRERRLGWLPELLASAEVLMLRRAEQQRPETIADLLELSRESVENILSGPADRASQCVDAPPPQADNDRELAAGGLVRRVWEARSTP